MKYVRCLMIVGFGCNPSASTLPDSSRDDGGPLIDGAVCSSDETETCDCIDGLTGVRSCIGGSWGLCDCPEPEPPVFLTPISTTTEPPSLIRVYFTATDRDGLGITDLRESEFVLTENGEPLSRSESSFTVRKREAVEGLDLRTVLLLDLSRSVVEADGLPTLRAAAHLVIDGLQPEQSLQIMTFADTVEVRQTFTQDQDVLHGVVDLIDMEQGASTNLYGAVSQALGQWSDGFSSDGSLNVGLLVLLTDGSDTAGVRTLEQALQARGEKRLIAVGVGSEIDPEALAALGNYGVLSSDFATLESDIATLVSNMQRLNDSVYFASYCSPKRGGEHTLEITVEQNLGFPFCTPSPPPTGGRFCVDDREQPLPSWLLCTESCCPPDAPYLCADRCYATAAAAEAACSGSMCHRCGSAFGGGPTPVLVHRFHAGSFSSGECTP